MKKNVSKADMIVRLVMAITLLVVAIIFGGYWWLLLLPAVAMVLTGVRRRCGFYAMFGLSTCKLEEK